MLVTSCPQAPCRRLDGLTLFFWGSPGCLMGVLYLLLLLSLLGL